MTDVPTNAVWFADRPRRQAGSTEIPVLLGLFFNDQLPPPNAALQYDAEGSGRAVAVFELSAPNYDADAHTLEFDARIVEDPESGLREGSALTDFALRQDPAVAPSFTAATVFLDSGNTEAGDTAKDESGFKCEEYDAKTMLCEKKAEVGSRAFPELNCAEHDRGGYVRRDSATLPDIFDAPRYAFRSADGAKLHIPPKATGSVPNVIGSRLATKIEFTVLGNSPTQGLEYELAIWCTSDRDAAWVIFG